MNQGLQKAVKGDHKEKYHGVMVSDILQMCCLNMLTGTFWVTDKNFSGQIFIKNGEIVHAHAEGMSGETAFYMVVCHAYGDIEFKEGPLKVDQTIQSPWEHLLLEASRQQDQQEARGSDALFPNQAAEPSLIHIKVKRMPLPQFSGKTGARKRARKAGVHGIIKKRDMAEECVIDTITDEDISVRTLGSFQIGDRVRLIFSLPPRQDEVTVGAEISSISDDTISIKARFLNPSDHVKKVIGFFLWNS
jgi:hypothetical protein